MTNYGADYVNGVFTTNVTKVRPFVQDETTRRVLDWLNKSALVELKREAEATVAFWTHPRFDPIEPWRLSLREYVNEIRKEREGGH